MLIKTIEMESEDSLLFSKSAPLLAAASEVAYYTVRCSNLSAEELRREHGMEALFVAFERCCPRPRPRRTWRPRCARTS